MPVYNVYDCAMGQITNRTQRDRVLGILRGKYEADAALEEDIKIETKGATRIYRESEIMRLLDIDRETLKRMVEDGGIKVVFFLRKYPKGITPNYFYLFPGEEIIKNG